ncbi:cryptochrome/photolyase family protein [Veronia pacifica]|uniref:Deoxyribodipyrimidine photolyase n=1 Tax=Veronia pacifica TaxID=1080227 RepID=A0A1C3EKG3_9GAMM|nr:cryptochrome/photolyase family protein [Veronia pacifica]ODA33736.1 deoxyribodipyrimidine photolyase [Veronia pacifica]
MKTKTIRLILGDQLNASHSWFKERDDSVLYLVCEMKQETAYVKHHVQKVTAFFLAMEKFALALQKAGHNVTHLTLDDTANDKTFLSLITRLCKEHKAIRFEYQHPDEFRLNEQFNELQIELQKCGIQSVCYDSEHFLLPFEEISTNFTKGKHLRLETFYRKMRKRFDVLMESDKPVGGKWNYDADNRKKLKKSDIAEIPAPLVFDHSTSEVAERLARHEVQTIGEMEDSLGWPVSRSDALKLLDFFIQHQLPDFGRFQDAMTCQTPHSWSLYHSRLSFALNAKMLQPMQVIQAAVSAYLADHASIQAVEGFIRQILGWREYIRGIYWCNMPEYAEKNHFEATRDVPEFFWNGETGMKCMSETIKQSLKTAYAHHIQRLMVTGNFSLLTGLNPDQVDAWYLGIYIDAIEWVEMPNTRGMSLFADGGIIATKPYCASGSYISRMSDYCSHCKYKVKLKTGDDACPLNSLYWDFMVRHRDELTRNPRIGMIFGNWDRLEDNEQQAILSRADWIRNNLDQL